jgi:phosphoribulokinase
LPQNRSLSRPVILGIVGDSASGKTSLASGVATILGRERVIVLCSDDYHRMTRTERAKAGVTPLDPAINYMDIFEQHIRLLRDGQPILKPVYDHKHGMLGRPAYITPTDYIIVEGLLPYHTRGLRDCFDVKIYLDPEESLRAKWKIRRDSAERGYTPEQAEAEMISRHHDSAQFILPQRTFADIVIRFFKPEGDSEVDATHLNVRHTLRPTLPHPDMTPILDVGGRAGYRLQLARDVDGKPVDVLDIMGDIDDRRARTVEDLLWSLIPEAHHLRDHAQLGRITDEHNQSGISHPLALSQLLVTYHLVKAALGHNVV